MYPDPNWLNIFKLPLKATSAIALTASALLLLEILEVINFGNYKEYGNLFIIIISVLFWTLTIISTIEWLFNPIREKRDQDLQSRNRLIIEKEKEEQREKKRQEILAYLDHLSDEEIQYVADSLRKGTPTFYTYVHSPPVGMMMGKGLVWTPGGSHNQDYYPFSFHNFVWDALIERKEELLSKDKDRKAKKSR